MARFSSFLLFGLITVTAHQQEVAAAQPVMDYSFNSIAPERIQQVVDAAVQGDSEAAFKLWIHYGLVENDIDEAAYWLRLSAEQGNCHAMAEFAKFSFRVKENAPLAKRWLAKIDHKKCNIQREDVTALRRDLAVQGE